MPSTRAAPLTDQFKDTMLELSNGQQQLREELAAYMAKNQLTSVTVPSQETGLNWNKLNAFQKSLAFLGSGSGFERFCKLLGCEDLGSNISLLTDQTRAIGGDRCLTLATCPPETIGLAIDLINLQRTVSVHYTGGDIAEGFGVHSPIVLGVLNWSRSELGELENPETLRAIQALLHTDVRPDLLAAIERAKQRRNAGMTALGKRLGELVDQLQPRYGNKMNIARALGVKDHALHHSIGGRATEEVTQQLIDRAERELRGKPPPVRASVTPAPAEPEPELNGSLLATAAGETSEDGIRYILTEQNFQEREIGQVSAEALMTSLKQLIPATRALLVIASQCKADDVRKEIRTSVGREVAELELALRTFTFAHPNEMLPLYDSQRQVWAADRAAHQSPSRKAPK